MEPTLRHIPKAAADKKNVDDVPVTTDKKAKHSANPDATDARTTERAYQPEIHEYARGSADLAINETITDAQKNQAMKELLEGRYSRGSGPQRDAAWSTWTRFHRHWFSNTSYLPLTILTINAVAALFKKGRYRTFSNYLSIARSRHLEEGYDFTKGMEQAATNAEISVPRGKGPGVQAPAVGPEKLADAAWGHVLFFLRVVVSGLSS